ncbi:Glutathione transferase FosA [Frankia canadensis]|uniref:Glutathione transferase FosA n=1 Tax=Frankia canadensis TaxID=1836972 RepID=A0A2I2KP02_9ACTN|nr:VOC family protein [Frankia canadensis]SNQ47394.1 Glutathione transferase FosA [Frankia canadensis]SOU54684.1 Glutathione transferase FosA [Frankia canadensis]
MAVALNHTIVHARDRAESAAFLAHILGLEVGQPAGHFLPVTVANGVTLDFATQPEEPITAQHYAFLITEEEFDAAFARLLATGNTYWADPRCTRPGEINHHDGGRGVYFLDPSGHFLEMITRPYGG